MLARLTVPVGAAVEMAWLPRWEGIAVAPALNAVRALVWAVATLAAGLVIARYLARRPSRGRVVGCES